LVHREVDIVGDQNAPPVSFTPTASRLAGNNVELVEEKVFAVLDGTGERDCKRWIFDTGESNHMTGSRGSVLGSGLRCLRDGTIRRWLDSPHRGLWNSTVLLQEW
jgi:hypothetical protein